MTRSKQIIYPMRYVGLSLNSHKNAAQDFSSKFATFLGGEVYVQPIGRARAGLYLLAKLAISEHKRRVILSPYTIPDVINMIKFAGGEPVFVDSNYNSTNVDLDQLDSLIDESVCCVIVTHYHLNQNLAAIRAICSQKGVLLIDDCALALGATEPEGSVGTVTDASVFSFSGYKALNYFWGGAITTRTAELAQTIRKNVAKWSPLRWKDYNGQMLKLLKYDVATRNPLFSAFTFPVLRKKVLSGGDAEILPLVRVETSEITRSILSLPSDRAFSEWNRKISMVTSFLHHRRAIAAIYEQRLGDHLVGRETSSGIRAASCWVNYPIVVDPQRRTELYKKILAQGMDIGLSLYPNTQEVSGFTDIAGRSENVSKLVRSVLYLPTHPAISAEYATRLADVVASSIVHS
jgi:perosamine synthetase